MGKRVLPRGLLVLPLLAFGTSAFAVPKLLIVQTQAPTTKDGDPNIPVANLLSQEIDDNGKLSTIVWSLSDPTFREAAFSGKLRNLPDVPKHQDAVEVARQLGAEYLLEMVATRAGKQVKATLHLFKGGKEIWKDTESLAISTGVQNDLESGPASIARTVALKMSVSPFKELPVQQKATTPEAARGQAPVPVAIPAPTPKSDNAKLKSDLDALLKEKRTGSAITMLRDAIDVDPFDAERRMMLVNLLGDRDAASAASEAKRASNLLPERNDLRLLAARAYLKAGMNKEAQETLNEAMARAPEATGTRLLLAEVALKQLQPEMALPHLDEAIKNEPSAEAYFLRAVCRAELGGSDGVKLDIQAMTKASAETSPIDVERRYRIALPILDQLLTRSFDAMRDLTQRAIVKPKDAEVQDSLDSLQRVCAARTALLTSLPVPLSDQKLHDRWVLAHRLFAQSLVDLRSFTGGSADSLVDARMNLGEAINQAKSARELSTSQN